MNHIYKVIWNKAKNCYTVVSEIAKSHSDSTKRVRMGTTAALMAVAVLTGFAMPAQAAVSIESDGTVKAEAADINALNNLLKNGVTTNKDGSVTVGGLTVKKNGEVSVSSPDVVYGKKAKIIWDSNNTMGQISIGNNATTITGRGGQERSFAYDGDANHAAGAIAIGANTYARTGSIMIGSHVYKGNMGDVKNIDTDIFNTDRDGAYGFTVNSTTIGTNSFTRGNLATTIGDYNIQSGKSMGYNDWEHWNPSSLHYGAQNFGATVIGALNSNESQSAPDPVDFFGTSTSGVANSIVGVANKVNSSNGTLVFGAGNEVTHSLSDISGVDDTTFLRDAKNAQDALKKAVATSDAGGAVLAIGGANKADWAQKSQLVGVGNTLTGTSNAVSKYDMINGYKNEVTNATHTSIIGSNNKANDVQATTVMGDNNDLTGNGNHVIGDNHKVTGKNNILIGNNKEQKTHSGSDSVIIGNNASAGNGSMVMGNKAHAGNTGIALGMNASAGDGQNLAIGYYANVSGATNSTALGYASKVEKRDILSSDGNDGVVSVGKSVGQSGEAGITRRIINVKAGVNDTDAVNVSQLKGVETIANKGWNLTTGVVTDATQVKPGDTVDFSGDKNISVSHKGTDVSIALKDTLTLGSNATDGYVTVDGVKGTVWAGHAVSAGNVNMDGDSGEITGLTNTTLNSKDFATTGRAATEEQLKLVKNQADSAATEASKHSKVVNGSNITVEETDQDGQKTYKVGLNKNLEGIESISNGDAKINLNDTGVVISKGKDKTFSITDTGMGMSVIGDDYVTRSIMVGKTGTVISGGLSVAGSKITNVAAGSEDTDAVNVSQLKGVENIANKGWHLSTNGVATAATNVAPGGYVDFSGDDNISVSNKETKVTVALNKDVQLNSATFGDTVINSEGLTIGGGTSGLEFSKNRVSVGGQQIHDVADGKDDMDAVNMSQLKKQTAASKTTVSDGTNTTVTSIVAEDGHTDYKVNLNKDLTGIESMTNGLSSIRMGNGGTVTINNRVTIDQSGKISGVAAGSEATDAVNVAQLKQVASQAEKANQGWNLSTNGVATAATNVAPGDYVDFSGDDNVSVSNEETKVKVALNKDVQLNSATFEDTVINSEGLTIGNGTSGLEFSKNRVSVGGQQIHDVADGKDDMDAVNMSQLKKQTAASKTTVSDGTNTTVTSIVAEDGHTDYKVNLNKDLTGIESMTNGLSSIRMGNGGTVTINNRVTIDQSGKISGVAAGEVKEGSTDAVNGSQLKGVENKADKNSENIQKNTEAIAKNTEDISKNAEAISKNTENIKNNSDAIAKNAENIQKNTKAIAKNTEDISKNTEAIGKLDERVTSVEEVAKKHTTVSTDDKNVQISEDTNKDGGKDYKVSLNKDLNLSSVTTGDTKMDTNGITVKDVSLTKDGLSIGNKTYVSNKGLNANDQKVTNVAAGDISEKSTDAVNGSQLFATNQQVAQNAQSINKLGNRINKVGAGAAALAALHPLDFDPDDKWDFAAGYGNYNGENAAAIGAYYRPNEDTMFSVGGSFGNGENMVNAGISLKLGQGNHVSTSKVAMAKEIKDLRKELEGLKSALLDVNAGKKLDTSKLQLFPDVPKNHWAYEYVSTLKGNGVLTGYPDGEFKGDRPMTRYEFATMLYKAMLEGATLSDKILKEFAPELEHFTVDTVHQDKDGKPTVERVRTVKAEK